MQIQKTKEDTEAEQTEELLRDNLTRIENRKQTKEIWERILTNNT